jgi:hypothetical protein
MSDWIYTKDKFPLSGDIILIATKFGKVSIGYFSPYRKRWYVDGCILDNVIAWMELPKISINLNYILLRKLTSISWSTRALNTFLKAGITTFEELTQWHEIDFLKLGGCGKKTLNEIKWKLENMNLALGMWKLNKCT